MEDWKITVVNKTGDRGLAPVNVNFMLFQIPLGKLTTASLSKAWKVAEVGYPGSVGPIVVPSDVQFYVKDRSHGNCRSTGPFDATSGQTFSVLQKNVDEVPKVTLTSEEAPEGEIKVINEKGNAKPLEMALSKDGKGLLSFKTVRPADAVYLAVEPAIYIADVDGPVVEGADFQACVQAENSTKFHLYPHNSQVTILIKQLKSGELQFMAGPVCSHL